MVEDVMLSSSKKSEIVAVLQDCCRDARKLKVDFKTTITLRRCPVPELSRSPSEKFSFHESSSSGLSSFKISVKSKTEVSVSVASGVSDDVLQDR